MGKLRLVGKLILVLIIVGLMILVVQYADTIRGTAQYVLATKSVKGAQTSFEKEINKNLKEYTKNAESQIMNVKIADIVNGVLRVRKIGKDIQNVKEYIVKETGNIFNK
jgi:hypothetical protein